MVRVSCACAFVSIVQIRKIFWQFGAGLAAGPHLSRTQCESRILPYCGEVSVGALG